MIECSITDFLYFCGIIEDKIMSCTNNLLEKEKL